MHIKNLLLSSALPFAAACGLLCLSPVSVYCAEVAAAKLELRDGDRVLLLGDTFIEREQSFGLIETSLLLQFPTRKVTFRNLGWSADTPTGRSRASFDWNKSEEHWRRHLLSQIRAIEPTVVFLGYGMASSFDGPEGLPKFAQDLRTLIRDIRQLDPSGQTRFVLLSPIRHENLAGALPDPAPHNAQLDLYRGAIREVAQEIGAPFIDLFHPLEQREAGTTVHPLTDNGIHLNALGYFHVAHLIEQALGLPRNPASLSWHSSGTLHSARFPVENLRRLVLNKNELFFHRWRPQNQTYLFGFRRHEQGRNAGEIPQFDPLVAAKEQEIFKLLATPPSSSQLDSSATASRPAITGPTPPAGAAESRERPLPQFEVAPGFKVELFAADPLLAKPIQMNFDALGRLWVASSSIYPQIEPGQPANDKIILLEDTDGDGRAETSSVFAEGLLIPTGIAPGDGGVYVGQSTQLLHFRDTTGDGRADEKRIVLSSFGTEDTHHILHTLHWGHDGRLYFNQSIYIHSHIETPHGVVRLNSGGVFKFLPRSERLEVFVRGFCNPWGHQFDRYGQSFLTDGAGFQGISLGIPGATYFTYADMRREMRSVSPGNYPKFCGIEIIENDHFPSEWQGSVITCDFRAHRIVRFALNDAGAGHVTRQMPDLLRTDDVSFRPIDVKLGPDGALYIADWSNPIIQHGEVDFRDPRRDHESGRIWRVSAVDRALLAPVRFATAPTASLLDQLLAPNKYNRQQAHRVLAERGAAILSELRQWLDQHSSEPLAQLEALWTFQSVDQVEPPLLAELLRATDGRIRAAAARVAGDWSGRLANPLDLLAPLVADPHPRVRLEAVRALATVPHPRAAELVLTALDHPMDDFIDYGVWLSINDLATHWIRSVKEGAWDIGGRQHQLEFALRAIPASQASEVLDLFVRAENIDPSGDSPWLTLIERAGSPRELRLLLDLTLSKHFTDDGAAKALSALAGASESRQLRPSGNLKGIEPLIAHHNSDLRTAAIRLAGTWRMEPAASALLELAKEAATSEPLRRAAFDALRQIGAPSTASALASILQNRNDPLVARIGAAHTLATIKLEDSISPIIRLMAEIGDESQALALWRPLLQIKGASEAFTAGLREQSISPASGAAGLRAAREGGRLQPNLILAISQAAHLEDEQQNLTTEEIQQLAQLALRDGDLAAGETIYRRQDLGCMSCHAIGGAGGKVGPDLTSIGASSPVDYLIESLLYPNRKIKEGYHSILVETTGDQEFAGTLASENSDQIVIRDALNREIAIPKSTITRRSIGASLMPSGLLITLSHADQKHLYRFLAELGKPGPYDASRGNTARAWKLYPLTIDALQFGDEKIITSDLAGQFWADGFTRVDGALPGALLRDTLKSASWRNPTAVYAITELEVPAAGPVEFQLTSPAEPDMIWIDNVAVSFNNGRITQNLGAGRHRVAVKFGAAKLPETFKLTSAEATFLTQF